MMPILSLLGTTPIKPENIVKGQLPMKLRSLIFCFVAIDLAYFGEHKKKKEETILYYEVTSYEVKMRSAVLGVNRKS